MTNEEAKNALMSECPVMHEGIEYKCVSAIIYRKKKIGKKKIVIPSLELTDKSAAGAVVIAPVNRVHILYQK